ncbi:hypothetical protein [Arsenicibacter rosenii]|uniref:Uncharacterized protein n=1 Tax=Arsenicibacter rosenii TaxID=1750698 RepID=A0A1S2VMQ2_9BACT|nr:hypothetical protein [Arsenicibacter rosenii]OIN60052.1 hypothetical protein BLX24_04160 [Arsenicibacter rosenii]
MNMQNKNTIETNQNDQAVNPYQKFQNGTIEIVSAEKNRHFKYLEGHPRQYRFDAKEGGFNINGAEKLGNSLTFQPIAWRIFTDNILNMGTKNWAEIFFVDDKNCVSAVLFHGYSVDNIFRLIEPLYYDDLTLADVVITAVAEKKENNKIQPKGIYHIATFSYKLGTPERTAELKQFAQEHKIFRQETLTDIANIKTAFNYYNPFANLGDETDAIQIPVTTGN